MNWVFQGLKKSNTFWFVSFLVEIKTGQGTGNCMSMPSKLENALLLFISVRKLVGSLFTSGLLYTFNFTQVKVKKVGIPHRMNLTSLKKVSSLKNAIIFRLA